MASSLQDVYHSIKAVLDVFKRPHEPTADVPSKQTILQAAEQIKANAAKSNVPPQDQLLSLAIALQQSCVTFVILYIMSHIDGSSRTNTSNKPSTVLLAAVGLLCSGIAPPQDQLLSLATALQQSCVTFVMLCHTLTAAAGQTLKKELLKLAQSLVNPCLMLVKEMDSGKDLKPYVGLVWDGVGGVPKASFDNKTCVFKGLAAVMAVIKDTAREVEELQAEQQQQYGDADPGNSSEQQQQQLDSAAAAAATDLDYDGGQMNVMELKLLDGSLQLIAAAADTLKAFGKALLQGPELVVGTDQLDSWESCLFHTQHLKRAVEDLGAAMYPPQDFEEVGSAALAVFEITELMIDECPCDDQLGAEQISKLSASLTAAHESMSELVQQAQQQENNAESDTAAESGEVGPEQEQ